MTLHEAIELVLKEQQQPMLARELADEINKRNLYQRGDGGPVPHSQILLRVQNYSNLFIREGNSINLVEPVFQKKEAENFDFKILQLFDSFRGHIDSRQLIDSLLPLLVLKYISDLDSSERSIYNIELSDTTNWETILNLKFQTGDSLNILFHELEQQNPFYTNVFSNFDYNDRTVINDEQLNSLIHLVTNIDFNIPSFIFGDFVDAILIRLTRMKGKSGEVSLQPTELTKLMKHFIPKKDNLSIYNPFAGYASFALDLPKSANYYGQEINQKVWAIARLRMLAHALNHNLKLACEDSIYHWRPFINNTKFDFIVCSPPFGVKLNNKERLNLETDQRLLEPFIIESAANSLSNRGLLVITGTHGLLFRVGTEKRIRQEIISSDLLEMIIGLPGNLFSTTSVPSVILVLNKAKTTKGKVKFIDASECYKQVSRAQRILDTDAIIELINSDESKTNRKIVSNKEIEKNEFNLSINRYLYTHLDLEVEPGTKLLRLDELLEVYPKSYNQQVISGKYVRIRDLANDQLNNEINFSAIETIELPPKSVLLNKNSILLALRWNTLKPTFFTGSDEPIYYSSLDIGSYKIAQSQIDKDYLINELASDYVQNQLNKYKVGSIVSSISKSDLGRIQIKIPSLEEQKRKVLEAKLELISREENKIVELRKNFGIDVTGQNSLLRHQIAGRLKSTRGAFKNLKGIIEHKLPPSYNDLLELKTNASSALTFKDYLRIIERDLNTIHQTVIRSSKEMDLSEMSITEIDVIDFVHRYYKELKGRSENRYNVRFSFDRDSLKTNEVNKVLIKGDTDLIRSMFDNLVENAEKHAFDESASIKNRLDIDILLDFNRMEIQIDFSNTGKPFPENFNFDNFINKNNKAGKNRGEGFGGWYINEVMKIHGGALKYIDETSTSGVGEGLASTFELHFPIEIQNYE